MTTQEELTLLETAYTNFLSGGGVQSYTINGRTVTKTNLKDITTRIDQLRRQLLREQNGGSTSVVRFVERE